MVFVISKFDYAYANFDITANMLLVQPREFSNALCELLFWAGPTASSSQWTMS